MGKRDKKDTFSNPFAALKGLSVSGSGKVTPPGKATVPPAAKSAPEPEAEPNFDAAMAQLGVRRIQAGDAPLRPAQRPVTVEARSEQPSGAGGPRPGKVLKEVQRGQIHPEAELDLHGMTAAQALPKVGWFLENAAFHGCEVVRIVTGRGKTSAGEQPVLKPQVEALLNGPLRGQVVEWGEAPKGQGGAGALIVVLHNKSAWPG